MTLHLNITRSTNFSNFLTVQHLFLSDDEFFFFGLTRNREKILNFLVKDIKQKQEEIKIKHIILDRYWDCYLNSIIVNLDIIFGNPKECYDLVLHALTYKCLIFTKRINFYDYNYKIKSKGRFKNNQLKTNDEFNRISENIQQVYIKYLQTLYNPSGIRSFKAICRNIYKIYY